MKKKSKIPEIYGLLIGKHEASGGYQFYASKIADSLNISRSYVSQKINWLLNKKFVVCDNPKGKPKFYSPTRKEPSWFKERKTFQTKLTGYTPVMLSKLTGSLLGRVFTTSKTQWSCHVSFIPEKLEGWRKICLRHGVVKYYKEILFDKPVNGALKFQIVGRDTFTLTVTFPHMPFDGRDEFLKAKDIIGDYARGAVCWLKQKYNFGLDPSTIYLSHGDFETPLRDADVKRFIETANVRVNYHHGKQEIGRLMFDGSGRVDRAESNIPDWVVDYVEIPGFSRRLRNTENNTRDFKKDLDEIKDLLKSNHNNYSSSPDERRDVA